MVDLIVFQPATTLNRFDAVGSFAVQGWLYLRS
jgi:hypothetical protein